MPPIKAIQRVIEQLNSGALLDSDIVRLLHDPSPVVRASAIDATAKRAEVNDKLLDDLFASVFDPANGVRLMGRIKVADVAICALLRMKNGQAREYALRHISSLSELDRADLLAYLLSEGVICNLQPKLS